jgi:Zn-dependent peptidase ImmA (M78 family)
VGVFPVDLQRICKGEGLTCIERKLDDELSGMSFIRNGVGYVVVNSAHPINRQRFTMAHEMGHHILHADYLARNVHVDTGVLRRDELSGEGIYSKEIAANAFAAELLMPRNQMGKFAALDLSDEIAVTKAAREFGVSATALTYRITNLANRRYLSAGT